MQDPHSLPLMGISLGCTAHDDNQAVVLEISADREDLPKLRKIVEASLEKIPLIFPEQDITIALKSPHSELVLDFSGDDELTDLLFKSVLLGDTYTGKTQICERYLKSENYQPTHKKSIGVNFGVKNLSFGPTQCRLQVWDVASADRFANMMSAYLRGTDACLLCIDLHMDPQRALNEVEKWLKVIHDHTGYPETTVMLVGTKIDDKVNRKMSFEQAESLAQLLEMPYIECSAHKDINISALFETVAKMLILKQPPRYKFSVEINGVRIEQLSSPDFYYQLNQHLQGCIEFPSSEDRVEQGRGFPRFFKANDISPEEYKNKQLKLLDEFIEKIKNKPQQASLRKQ